MIWLPPSETSNTLEIAARTCANNVTRREILSEKCKKVCAESQARTNLAKATRSELTPKADI